MLASTYMQAKATCDQVSALDAVLDKELMLEAMQQVCTIFATRIKSNVTKADLTIISHNLDFIGLNLSIVLKKDKFCAY